MAQIQQSKKLLTKADTCRHKDIEQQILDVLKQNPGSQTQWEPRHNHSSIYKSMESLRKTLSRIGLSHDKPGYRLDANPNAGANTAVETKNSTAQLKHTTNIVHKHSLMPIRKSSL